MDTVDTESLYIHDSVDHPVTLHSGGTSYSHLLNQENMMESPCISVDFCSNASCILLHSPTSWMNKNVQLTGLLTNKAFTGAPVVWKKGKENYTCFKTLFRRLWETDSFRLNRARKEPANTPLSSILSPLRAVGMSFCNGQVNNLISSQCFISWGNYRRQKEFLVYTDHKNLKYLQMAERLSIHARPGGRCSLLISILP